MKFLLKTNLTMYVCKKPIQPDLIMCDKNTIITEIDNIIIPFYTYGHFVQN